MVELDEVLEVFEVLWDEGEPGVVDDVFGGVFILVERVEVPGAKPFEDGA